MKSNTPEYQDLVKHKLTEVTGTVIAVYSLNGIPSFDVRSVEDKIYYGTPAENWAVIRKEKDICEDV